MDMEKEQLAEWVFDTMNGFLPEDSCMKMLRICLKKGCYAVNYIEK